ncbi:MAG: hypothetical protein A2096_17495 [Spirochaetes bacterium GWF1_41_5]|nr:MAG: hypothetical protein A2096_17495 [Spirochaetes bacterium GWF1_41_5]HBE02722.1 hypothetical protein [Spirochaetia bacterium]
MKTGKFVSHHELFNGVEKHTLANGLTVLLKEDHRYPVAALQLWIKTGSINEENLLGSGVSHYTEHCLFLGTGKRPEEGRISRELESYGAADLNAHTSFEHTAFHFTVSDKFISEGLDILSDMVFHSRFPASACEREKNVILSEMDMSIDDPERIMNEIFFSEIYNTHYYRIPVIGFRDIFSGLKHQELTAYYKQHYTPDHTVLAAVGNFTTGALLDLAVKYFGGLMRSRGAETCIPGEPQQKLFKSAAHNLKILKPRVRLGCKTCSALDDDVFALDALSVILTGGRNSLLYKKYISAGMLTDLHSYSWTPGCTGYFELGFTCREEKQAASYSKTIRNDVQSLAGKISGGMLEEAKHKIIADFINHINTVSGIAGNMAAGEILCGSPIYDRYYLDQIKGLKTSDVTRVIEKYFSERYFTELVFLPEKKAAVLPASASALPERKHSKTMLGKNIPLLLLRHNNTPVINAALVMQGGLEYEKEHQGLFNLFSRMLMEGTRRHSKEEVNDLIEKRGGDLKPFSGYNTFGLTMNFMENAQESLFSLLTEIITKPEFSEKRLAILKTKIIEEIDLQQENIGSLSELEFKKHIFRGHPYAGNKRGTKESISAITPRLLAETAARFLVSGNSILSAAGPAGIEVIKNRFTLAAADFSVLPSAGLEKLEYRKMLTAECDKIQTAYRLGFRTCPLAHEDARYLDLLDACLSGMGGPLFRIRESTGNSYHVGCYNQLLRDTGIFVMFIITGAHAAESDEWILEQFLNALYNIKKGGLENSDIERALCHLLGQRDIELQSPLNTVMNCALYELYGAGYERYFHEYAFPSAISVVRDKLVQTACRYFHDDNFLFLKLHGNKKNSDSGQSAAEAAVNAG